MKAWKVDINDCDRIFVLANDEDAAKDNAIIETCRQYGCTLEEAFKRTRYGDNLFSETITARHLPELDGDALTFDLLNQHGYCRLDGDNDEPINNEPATALFTSTEY